MKDQKNCPACAKTVLCVSVICKHCGYEFDRERKLNHTDKAISREEGVACLGCMLLIALLVAGAVALMGA